MTRSPTAALRRSKQLVRPAGKTTTTRALQKALTGVVLATALTSLATLKPATAKPPKTRKPKVGRALKAAQKRRAVQSTGPVSRDLSRKSGKSQHEPEGPQYLTRTHRCAAGSRGYKLCLPAGRPKGLILMLHGCSQTPDDFSAGTNMNKLAEKHGLAIAYPAQTRRNSPVSCWNWYKPVDQVRSLGEPAILASLTRKLMREFDLDRDAVFTAGFSAGGGMAAILADVYPDLFSAACVHSGLARGSAHSVVSAMAAMRMGGTPSGNAPTITTRSRPVRRIIFQGKADKTINPSNAALIVAAVLGGDAVPARIVNRTVRERGYTRSEYAGSDEAVLVELWMIEGTGHAWSGGRKAGSYTDSMGPDASTQMVRFFLAKSA